MHALTGRLGAGWYRAACSQSRQGCAVHVPADQGLVAGVPLFLQAGQHNFSVEKPRNGMKDEVSWGLGVPAASAHDRAGAALRAWHGFLLHEVGVERCHMAA